MRTWGGLVGGFTVALVATGASIACGDDDPAGAAPDAGVEGSGSSSGDGGGADGASSSSSGGTSGAPLVAWSVLGEAVSEGAVKSVARDDTHVFISSTGTGAHAGSHVEKRRLSDGQLETGFGDGGYVALPPSSFITVDATAIYVASLDLTLRKLAKADGAQLWENVDETGKAAARGIAVDASGVYVAAATFTAGFGSWVAMKLALDTGAVLPAFKPSLPNVFGGTSPRAIVRGKAALFIGGDIANSSSAPTNYAWRVQALDPETGASRWDEEDDPTQYSDTLRDVAVTDTHVYAIIRDYSTGAKALAWDAANGTALVGFKPAVKDDPYRLATAGGAVYLGSLTGVRAVDPASGAATGACTFKEKQSSLEEILPPAAPGAAPVVVVGTTRPGDAGTPLLLSIEGCVIAP